MCWAYRVANAAALAGVEALDHDIAAPHDGRITRAGKEAAVLVKRKGEICWLATRYGMLLPQAGAGRQLIWNARDDKLDTVELWSRLLRQRFVVPVDAYVETAPIETWYVGPTAWMVGFYDLEANGGAVAVTEACGDRRIPILVDQDAAMAWLTAQQWDAVPDMLRAPRVGYDEADIFQAKALSTDAKTKVPLPKAA